MPRPDAFHGSWHLTQRLLDRFLFLFYCEDMGVQLDFPPALIRKVLAQESQDERYQTDGIVGVVPDAAPLPDHARRRPVGGLSDPPVQRWSVCCRRRARRPGGPELGVLRTKPGESATRLLAHPRTLLFFSARYRFGATDTGDGQTVTLTALGRIFEQSITDLEVMEARASGRASLSEITRRKRDGVYYTPEWVTRYIVEQTVGQRLEQIRSDAGSRPDGRGD